MNNLKKTKQGTYTYYSVRIYEHDEHTEDVTSFYTYE